MAASKIEEESYLQLDNDYYQTELQKAVSSTLPNFDRIVKFYAYGALFFAALITVELIFLTAFFPFLMRSSIAAFPLAGLFLTLFTFLMARLWKETRKPERFQEFKTGYARACKKLIHYREGIPDHHFALAHAYQKLAAQLQGREYSYFRPPKWIDALTPTLEKVSCRFFWHDLHLMREILLKEAINEQIRLVKCEPTNLEVHAFLASAYVSLSSLYVDPRTREDYDDDLWIPQNKFTEELKEKFRRTAERAIEEFKVLNNFAPNDPWIHSQLAYSYHDLQMPEEEIKEYETILKLRPHDKETLFKLGSLYFQQGMNAQGLKIYESLKSCNFKRAEQLIELYGSYNQ